MSVQTYPVHENNLISQANQLGISAEKFHTLLLSANHAYEVIKELGPFYGQEHIKEPTFRITAEPVFLSSLIHKQLLEFGEDVLYLAKALKDLPDTYKNSLGVGLDYQVPFSWRVDAIFNNGKIFINELEAVDGASALMMAEQFAYNLQQINDSTATHIITTLRSMCGIESPKDKCSIALLKVNNPHLSNARRFIELIQKLSGGLLTMDLLLEEELREKVISPKWDAYNGILNETAFSPKELVDMGVAANKILFSGSFTALVNKGVFALIFDSSLMGFWTKHLGKERLERLTQILIPSKFVSSTQDIDEARKIGKVVKASWAGSETSIINRGRGVALPFGDVEQSTDERWNYLKELFSRDVKMIIQDFVLPDKISVYLRKKGTSLEEVSWHNRICVKYVCNSDPRTEILPSVSLTAAEATLGPDMIPAGRKCAFTAVAFEK